jgi:hypothetical protein
LNIALNTQTPPHNEPMPKLIDARRPGSPSMSRSRPERLPMNQTIIKPPISRNAVAHSHRIRSSSTART